MTYQLHPNSCDATIPQYLTIEECGDWYFHPSATSRVEFMYARDKYGRVWVNDFGDWRDTGIIIGVYK